MWIKGIWVGRLERTNEHIVLTKESVIRSRTVRCLPDSKRYQIDVFNEALGTPWDPKARKHRGRKVRRLFKALPFMAASQEEIDASVEVESASRAHLEPVVVGAPDAPTSSSSTAAPSQSVPQQQPSPQHLPIQVEQTIFNSPAHVQELLNPPISQ